MMSPQPTAEGPGTSDCPPTANLDELILPYGGALTNLMVDAGMAVELKEQSRDFPSLELTSRQLCDLELLLNGGFSPLPGFMTQRDYERVCQDMRLANGVLWPIPVVLDIAEAQAQKIKVGSRVALRDPEGVMLAVLTVTDMWRPDRLVEAEQVYGTTDPDHPGVEYLLRTAKDICCLGGKLQGLHLPVHYDFLGLRYTPAQLRTSFWRMGWRKVVAFQTRNPMHQAHFHMTLQAAQEHKANLLIHPATGMTKPGDVDHYCRVRCYRALLPRYPKGLATLSLLPLAMRMAGPREALWHAIIRRNYGCSQFIVGRDHAGPGSNGAGTRTFYEPHAAQDLVRQFESEIGVQMVAFSQMVYAPQPRRYLPLTAVAPGVETLDLSGTELRRRLQEGREIPDWFTFPEVAAELRRNYPSRAEQGFTVFFTGLSGSGKSTLARALLSRLLEIGGRPVTLLDGDIVRKNLSSELGFSREHRNLNILRIGFVANEITKNFGIAICAPIAPYDSIRKEVRKQIVLRGGFILVYVSTPLEICEQRDRKGLYAKARAGLLAEFTGISDPYEAPADADLVLDTTDLTVDASCHRILCHLQSAGYLPPEAATLDPWDRDQALVVSAGKGPSSGS